MKVHYGVENLKKNIVEPSKRTFQPNQYTRMIRWIEYFNRSAIQKRRIYDN
jgi:hypothetical protein